MAIVLFFNRSIVINGFKKLLNSLGVYTEVVKNVEITSTDYSNPGSWHIDKSAKWTETGKAQITFDINTIIKTGNNYKDVILILDVSGSMKGDKLSKVQNDSIELVEYLLTNPKNRVALITFESKSTIVSNFTNNKDDLVRKIRALGAYGDTNYNAGLQNVDVVMKGYTKEINRDAITLFLTDGYPNEDIPNQIGTYELLKERYPYMAINGVQYEMGNEIKKEIKEVTDAQWVANQITLNNILFEASLSPNMYEDFIVSDYIENEYFRVNSVNDIDASRGTVKLEEENGVQKVVWNLGKEFYTGASAQMNINVVLKDKYVGTSKFLPTNKKEEISYKVENDVPKEVKSNETPVLKQTYDVIYDTNTPLGCNLTAIPKESHNVFDKVAKKSEQLTCPGYLFRGWEFDGNDVKDITIVNDDNFIMPEHNVTIRATWSKQSVAKSMNGTVYEREKLYLYDVLKNEAESSSLAKEFTGVHQDSIKGAGSKKIYYYNSKNTVEGREIQDKNNVIFAGMCWQMIRTTDTGGVKMIYNGEPDAEGKCGTNRSTHVGYGTLITKNLASNYYYGTSYTYNSSTKMFSLDGIKTLAIWDETTGPTLVGQYTCLSENPSDTCTTLYYVESYGTAKVAYVLPLDSSAYYPSIGRFQYNALDGSLAYVGYMYNAIYPSRVKSIRSTGYTYAKSFTYSNGTYKLTNGVKTIYFPSKYDVYNPETNGKIVDLNDAHYTCFNTTGECTTLSYVHGIERPQISGGTIDAPYGDINALYINLTGGESVDDALNKMLKAADVNTTNSTIKSAIDGWYEKYMLNYADYLEDTIYCNDRSIRYLAGWDPNGGIVQNINENYYHGYDVDNWYGGTVLLFSSNYNNTLTCPNITDKFSVSNNKAKLKYPIGLMSVSEISLYNSVSNLGWSMTADQFGGTAYIDAGGSYASNSSFVRPTISLKAGTFYYDGDGSMDNPFIVE